MVSSSGVLNSQNAPWELLPSIIVVVAGLYGRLLFWSHWHWSNSWILGLQHVCAFIALAIEKTLCTWLLLTRVFAIGSFLLVKLHVYGHPDLLVEFYLRPLPEPHLYALQSLPIWQLSKEATGTPLPKGFVLSLFSQAAHRAGGKLEN